MRSITVINFRLNRTPGYYAADQYRENFKAARLGARLRREERIQLRLQGASSFRTELQPVAKRNGNSAKCWSERQDLNLRPPRPERGALPDGAPLRILG